MLNQLLTDLKAHYAADELITAESIIQNIDDLDQDLRSLVSWAVVAKVCTASEWRKAMASAKRQRRMISILGAVPVSPMDFVKLYANTLSAEVTGDGQVIVDEPETSARTVVDDVRFSRLCRIAADALQLNYGHMSVDDSTTEYLYKHRLERSRKIVAGLKYDPTASFDWYALADATINFDADAITPEYAVANLRHFVWQVKRKQAGLPIDHHLMLILGGAQDVGKSTFAKALFSPVVELTRAATFTQITDDRIIDIWSASVIFMDEMAFASKSDADEVKNVITADTMDRRPMRSNSMIKVPQKATMIGTTNQILAQIIRDTTGTRRFSFLPFSATPNHAVINASVWLDAWQSVDENAAAPILTVRDQLKAVQADSRLRSTVEQWIDTIDGSKGYALLEAATKGGVIPTGKLFEGYRSWCDVAEIAVRERLDSQAFTNELKRMNQMSATATFRFKRGSACNGFTYHGPAEPLLKMVR